MIAAVIRSLGAFRDQAIRRLFWIGVLGALAILILLILVLGYLIAQLRIVGADWGAWSDWAEWGLDFLSGAAVLFLVWITFPGMVGCPRRASRASGKRCGSPSISHWSALV